MLVVVVAVVALEWSVSFWLATYLSADVHLRLGVAVVMVSVLYAASLASRLIASRLARQVTARRLLLISLAVAFAGLVSLLVASDAAMTAVAVAITGLGIGGTFPLTSSLQPVLTLLAMARLGRHVHARRGSLTCPTPR